MLTTESFLEFFNFDKAIVTIQFFELGQEEFRNFLLELGDFPAEKHFVVVEDNCQ